MLCEELRSHDGGKQGIMKWHAYDGRCDGTSLWVPDHTPSLWHLLLLEMVSQPFQTLCLFGGEALLVDEAQSGFHSVQQLHTTGCLRPEAASAAMLRDFSEPAM